MKINQLKKLLFKRKIHLYTNTYAADTVTLNKKMKQCKWSRFKSIRWKISTNAVISKVQHKLIHKRAAITQAQVVHL